MVQERISTMGDIDKLTKDTIAKGGVLTTLYFDLHGTSKEMLQQMGAGFVERLLREPGVVYALGDILDPMQENELFSSTVEIKLLVKDLPALAGVCSNYSPFSIEILRPDEFRLTVDKMHELFMQISSISFEYKKYILERVATPAEVDKYKRSLQNKIELGKRLLEEKGTETVAQEKNNG